MHKTHDTHLESLAFPFNFCPLSLVCVGVFCLSLKLHTTHSLGAHSIDAILE